jgi:hypothetical protein
MPAILPLAFCHHSNRVRGMAIRYTEQLNYQRPSGLTACQRMFHINTYINETYPAAIHLMSVLAFCFSSCNLGLTKPHYPHIMRAISADIAQLVEQLTCNQ